MKMRCVSLVACVLAAASGASAALGDVSQVGLTGLWRFATNATKFDATVGTAMTTNDPSNDAWAVTNWIDLGTPAWHTQFSDGGAVQEQSWNYMTCTHGIAANGGGSYVNEYTIVMDYQQGSLNALWNGNYYNSLFQTSTSNSNDGDLFIKGPDYANSVIGNGEVGYSTQTFNSNKWNRIAISVDNGNFFRVYVDGVLLLDGAGQSIDGRFSLDPTVLLFADNDWEDSWGYVGTVATWNRAMGSAEIANLGGWFGTANPTPLILVPEPATMILLGLGSLVAIRRKK